MVCWIGEGAGGPDLVEELPAGQSLDAELAAHAPVHYGHVVTTAGGIHGYVVEAGRFRLSGSGIRIFLVIWDPEGRELGLLDPTFRAKSDSQDPVSGSFLVIWDPEGRELGLLDPTFWAKSDSQDPVSGSFWSFGIRKGGSWDSRIPLFGIRPASTSYNLVMTKVWLVLLQICQRVGKHSNCI